MDTAAAEAIRLQKWLGMRDPTTDPQLNPAPCDAVLSSMPHGRIRVYTFAATPDQVWKLLNDPDVVASCLPGCERLEPTGDDHYKAELNLAIAAVTGRTLERSPCSTNNHRILTAWSSRAKAVLASSWATRPWSS